MLDEVAHPWQSAAKHFQEVIMPRLKARGIEIGKAARVGDDTAITIIEKYQMLHRSFDPMTMTLLEDALKEYEAKTLKKP